MRKLVVLAGLLVLAGCAATPQLPVNLEQTTITAEKKVGVVLQQVPPSNVHLPGASCLLCIAAAQAANSALDSYVETWATEEFSIVESELVKRLQDKGVEVVAIEEDIPLKKLTKVKSNVPNTAPKDFRSYGEKYGIDQLLVIHITMVGVERQYSAYIPTSDPMAVLKGSAYLVDMADNTYKWYKPINLYKAAEGEWKEPPDYPGLTNAFYHVIEVGREMVLSEF